MLKIDEKVTCRNKVGEIESFSHGHTAVFAPDDDPILGCVELDDDELVEQSGQVYTAGQIVQDFQRRTGQV